MKTSTAWKIKAGVTAAILAGIVMACNSTIGEPVVPERSSTEEGTIVHLPAIDWYIVDEQKMRDVYVNAGMPLDERTSLLGFAAEDTQTGQPLIVTTSPRYVNDKVACTLGHEVMHVAYGAYHKEGAER